MNKRLKFSWGHIVALLALIFITYVTFMGITYMTLGNFIIAGIGCILCLVSLAVSILGAQFKKGTPRKFYKSILFERILLLVSPVVLFLAFIPYNHFWIVLGQEQDITDCFNSSIELSHDIFNEYESYADERCDNLSRSLSKMSVDKRNNRVEELRLLLMSENYYNLKKQANNWISQASQYSTVWNVFLLGNIEDVEAAVNKWVTELHDVSKTRLSCEGNDVQDFNVDTPAKEGCIKGLETLKQKYVNLKFEVNVYSIITMLLCWMMLMLPYFIQERHAANCEKFWDFWIFSHFYNSNKSERFISGSINDKRKEHGDDVKSDKTNELNKTKTRKGAPV